MSDKKPVYHVYNIMQAERVGGKFNKSFSTLQRTVKLTEKQAAANNKGFDSSGRFYKLVEKDVKAYGKTKSKG